MGFFNRLHLSGCQHGAASWKDGVHRSVFLATCGRLGPHAALADNQLDAGLPDELALEFLHAHAGGGADGDHFECAIFPFSHDGARMEYRPAFKVDRQFAALLDQTTVCNITAGHMVEG